MENERKQREREAKAKALGRNSIADMRALPAGVRHVNPSIAEQVILEDRQRNQGKVLGALKGVFGCLMKSLGSRDRSPTASIRSQQERDAHKKAGIEVAREDKTMYSNLPPETQAKIDEQGRNSVELAKGIAKADAAPPTRPDVRPTGSPRIPQVPAGAGPANIPSPLTPKKPRSAGNSNREIKFNLPARKPESTAESSNTTLKKLARIPKSTEDLRKDVKRTEEDEKKLNDAHWVALRLASEVRKYDPEEIRDCSEIPKIRPLETKYGGQP
jgi:hypothetical protein